MKEKPKLKNFNKDRNQTNGKNTGPCTALTPLISAPLAYR